MKVWFSLALALAGATLLLMAPIDLRGHPRLLKVAMDVGHTGLLAVLTLFLLRLWPRLPRLPAFLGLLALQALWEGAQGLVGRTPSLADLIMGGVGVLLAFALRSSLRSSAKALVAGTLLLVPSAWLLVHGLDQALARREFPLLSDFLKRPLATGRWETNGLRGRIARDRGWVLHVRDEKEPFPGVVLTDPVSDWSPYQVLVLRISNPQTRPLRLGLRLDDQEAPAYPDRGDLALWLAPGRDQVLRVPLADLARTPAGGRVELENVRRFALFLLEPEVGMGFELELLALE